STISLAKEIFTIGRLGDNDLRIPDSHVSRTHAEIIREGMQFRIVDRKSKSGTFVNGERILTHTLRHGDRIALGHNVKPEMIFLVDITEPPSRPDLPSFVTTSFLAKESSSDLRMVSRFLEGVRYFSAGIPLQEVLDVVLDMAVEISGADRAFLVLLDEHKQPVFRSGRNRKKESLKPDQFQISRSVLQDVLTKGERAILSLDSHPDALSEFQSAAALELRTVVCLPLRGMEAGALPGGVTREVMGALYLDSKVATKGLSNISEGLLESLAKDASTVLINMRLLREAREKELLEMELKTAREIQESLLPEICGAYGVFEACAENLPSRGISGDYYDLIALPDDRFAVVIADISGKGIPAAILTSLVQGALFVEVSRGGSLVNCMQSLNHFLVRRSGTNRFVSLFLAILDPHGEMSYVNAGHNPPFLLTASGEIRELTARGIVLGVVEHAVFEEKTVALQPGDVLCMYTDGVTEAQNAGGELFGEDRLRESLVGGRHLSAPEIMDLVLRSVSEHMGETARNDDVTMLVVKRS
ncbi:MAG TPA: SpoIIE family protein phosphatase, partial [Acidobacteriota bacterium]|nr:SpoIIE family protein phosphatase [Acidobacteriota bacterium]